jgi:hypothetical protein
MGEGIGFLIGKDMILTSAHNLIFSKENIGISSIEILNYKPYKITFNILSNGSMDLIKTINCSVDHFIFSDTLSEIIFEKNESDSYYNSNDNNYNSESIIRNNNNCNSKTNNFNDNIKINDYDNKNYNQYLNSKIKQEKKTNNIDSSSFHSINYNNNNNSRLRKRSINNLSEIPLFDDYAILFLDIEIGTEIISLFFDNGNYIENDNNNISLNSSKNRFNLIDPETGLFKIIEDHIDFVEEFQQKDNIKFKNSKISMVSGIKYNENLTGLPQYVYGSNFNLWMNKFDKNENSKNNFFNYKEKQKDNNNNPLINMNMNNNTNCDKSKNKNINKELEFCLFFNNSNNLRTNRTNIFQKLQLLNNNNFLINGKIILCEAKGKLCSLINQKAKTNFQKDDREIDLNYDANNFLYKNNNNNYSNNMISKPNYEVNLKKENFTPFDKDENINKDSDLNNNNNISIENLNIAPLVNNSYSCDKLKDYIIYLEKEKEKEREKDKDKEREREKDIFNTNMYRRKYTIIPKNKQNPLKKLSNLSKLSI